MAKIKKFTATLQDDKRSVKVEWSTTGSSENILKYGDRKVSLNNDSGEKTVQIEVSMTFKLVAKSVFSQDVKASVEVIVPNSDIASWVSNAPSELTITNRSLLTIDVFWINLYGDAESVKRLFPNESLTTNSYINHLWKLTDVHSGRKLLETRLSNAEEAIDFDGTGLKSKPQGEDKEFAVSNLTRHDIDLIHIDEEGNETKVRSVKTKASKSINLPDGSVLLARRTEGQGLLWMQILKHAVSSDLIIDLGLDDSESSVPITLENQLPFLAALYWISPEGLETKLFNIEPGEKREIQVEPHSRWLLKSTLGRFELLRFRAKPEGVSRHVLSMADLVSQPSGESFDIVLENKTKFLLDVYEADEAGTLTKLTQLQNQSDFTIHNANGTLYRFKEHRSQQDVSAWFMVPPDENDIQSDNQHNIKWVSEDRGGEQWVYLRNNTLLELELFRMKETNGYHHENDLEPGASCKHAGKVGYAWLVRDKASGQVLKFFRQTEQPARDIKKSQASWNKNYGWIRRRFWETQNGRTTVEINDNDLVSKVSDTPVTVTFTNNLPFSVDLYHISLRGEVLKKAIKSGESVEEESYALHAWKVRSTISQIECATYLLSSEAQQTVDISFHSPDSGEDTYIKFVNDSSLEVAVKWMDLEGKQRLMRTLMPNQVFYAQTQVGHFWLLQDVHSSAQLGITKGLKKGQEYSITGGSVIPELTGETFELKIQNDCTFDILIRNRKGEFLVDDQASVQGQSSGIGGGGSTVTGGAPTNLTLEPGDTHILSDAKKGAFWTAVHAGTQEQVAMYIADDAPEQKFKVLSRQVRKKIVVTAAVRTEDAAYLFQGPWPAVLNTFDDEGQLTQFGERGGSGPGREFYLDALISDPESILQDSGNNVWLISGKVAQKYNLETKSVVGNYHEVTPIKEVFPGISYTRIDAAVRVDSNLAWMFSGENALQYDTSAGEVVKVSKKISHYFPDLGFQRVDAALKTANGRLALFNAGRYAVVDAQSRQLSRNKESAYKIAGIDESTLPVTSLRTGEIEVFNKKGFRGESWIVRGACKNLDTVPGYEDKIKVKSVNMGPATGITAFSRPNYQGVNDVIYSRASTLSDTDVWEAAVEDAAVEEGEGKGQKGWDFSNPFKHTRVNVGAFRSVKPFQKAQSDSSEIKHHSVLFQDYQVNENAELEEVTVFRTNLEFPEGVEIVEVKAAEEVTITVSGNTYTIDAIQSAWLNPDSQQKIEISIPATAMSVSPLQVRMDTMPSNQWLVIFPDQDAFQKVQNLGQDDIFDNKEALGIKEEYTLENCRSLTQVLQNLGGMTEEMDLPPNTLRLGDQPHYSSWGLKYSAVGKKEAIYYPIHKEELEKLAQDAIDLDAEVGQGWKKLWKKVKDEAKNVADDVVEVASAVVDAVEEAAEEVEDVVDEIGDALEEMENIADLAKAALKVVIKIGETAYKFVVNTVQKVGAFAEFLIEQAGMAIDGFLDWIKSFFAWEDIIETHDHFMNGFNMLFTQMVERKDEFKSANSQFLTFAKDNWEDNIAQLQSLLLGERVESAGGKNDDKSINIESPELDWVLSKITSALDGISLDIENPFAGIESQIIEKVSNLTSTLGNAGDSIYNSISEAGSFFTNAFKDPANVFQNLLAGFLELVKGLGKSALIILEDLTDLIIDLAVLLMEGLQTLLNTTINIPILSDLYRNLTGSDLSILSLFSLVFAVPTTLLCKALTGEKPFLEGLTQDQREKQASITLRIIYTVSHGFLGIIAFVTFDTRRFMGKSSRVFKRDIALFVSTLALQISGNPLHPSAFYGEFSKRFEQSANSMTHIGNSNPLVKGPGVSSFVWYCQFLLVLWEGAQLVNSFKGNCLGHIPYWSEGFAKGVDCLLGLGHLAGMTSIAVFDYKQHEKAIELLDDKGSWMHEYTPEEFEDRVAHLKNIKNFVGHGYPYILKTLGNVLTTIPAITSPVKDDKWWIWKVSHGLEASTYATRMIIEGVTKKSDHIFVLG